MNLLSLLYVSRSTVPCDHADEAVQDIVAASRRNNPNLDVTGAMLFTGEHFAQVLEGPATTIDRLMAKVGKDPRHEGILVVAREAIHTRRFGKWSMAYSGPSQFVAGFVTRLLNEAHPIRKARSAEWLNDLLWEFAEGSDAD